MVRPDSLESDASPVWTVLVANSVREELSALAHKTGIALAQYVADVVAMRAAVELIAPSPTWLAIPADVSAIRLAPSPELSERVDALCQLSGHHHDVVVSNLASGGPPAPKLELALGYLRTDPGRGRMFGMYFEIPGFQYALMRHLAGETLTVSRVMDLAFLAIAKQAATTGFLNGHSISVAARQFATKVVMIENRRRAPR